MKNRKKHDCRTAGPVTETGRERERFLLNTGSECVQQREPSLPNEIMINEKRAAMPLPQPCDGETGTGRKWWQPQNPQESAACEAKGKHGVVPQALKLDPLSLRTAQHSTIVKIRPRICKTAMPRPIPQMRTRLLYSPFQRAVPQPCECRP